MNAPCTIRPGTLEDAAALTELLLAQMREHDLPAEPEAMEAAVALVFTRPEEGRFFVAVIEARVVGLAYVASLLSMEHGGRVSMLEELYVRPEHRGAGAGRALLQHVQDHSTRHPPHVLELEVDSTHQSIEPFYQRHGFAKRNRTRWLYRRPS